MDAQKRNKNRWRIISFIGSLHLFVAVSIYGTWLHACNVKDDHMDAVHYFHTFFPEFLQGRYDTIYLGLYSSVIALTASLASLQMRGLGWRILHIVSIVVATFLTLLNLFGLM